MARVRRITSGRIHTAGGFSVCKAESPLCFTRVVECSPFYLQGKTPLSSGIAAVFLPPHYTHRRVTGAARAVFFSIAGGGFADPFPRPHSSGGGIQVLTIF